MQLVWHDVLKFLQQNMNVMGQGTVTCWAASRRAEKHTYSCSRHTVLGDQTTMASLRGRDTLA